MKTMFVEPGIPLLLVWGTGVMSERQSGHKGPRLFASILHITALLWPQSAIVGELCAYFVFRGNCSCLHFMGVSVAF